MNKASGGGRIPAELFKILKCYSFEGPMPKLNQVIGKDPDAGKRLRKGGEGSDRG